MTGGTRRSVAVVGGGFGGVGAAVMLQRAGYDNVTVFERGERVGRVWHHNTYPQSQPMAVDRYHLWPLNGTDRPFGHEVTLRS